MPSRKRTETDQCPACLHLVETEWRILGCPARSVWRTNLLSTLTDVLHVNKTQPDLKMILLQGIRGALQNPQFQMPASQREPHFQFLVTAQSQMGWDNLLTGRFSHHWLQCQQHHIYIDPDIDTAKQSSERWLKCILHHIWTLLWQVWNTRNGDLHGRDRNARELKRKKKVPPRVTALYENPRHTIHCRQKHL
jgi:hypothetical protein